MSKEALPDHRLTEEARRARRYERCRAEYGISYDELCSLMAVIARWRCGEQVTTRADIREVLAEEGFSDTPGFRPLEKKRLLRRVSAHGHRGTWVPSPLALQKFGWVGRGRQELQGAAE